MFKILYLLILVVLFPSAAISQAIENPCSATGNAVSQSAAIKRTGIGAPYSLTATIKTEMKLADGNTISAFTTSRQEVDGQGRVRIEEPTFCAIDKDHQPHWQGSITVVDPVSKTYSLWQEGSSLSLKAATVTHVPFVKVSIPPTKQDEYKSAQQVSHAYEQAGNSSEKDEVEDLGKRTIHGLEASGFRTTRTIPSGAQGNSLPLTYVEDKWISDKYGIILLDTKDDPIFVKSTYEVTNFVAGEPDAYLFQVPADYKTTERNSSQ